MSYYVDVTLIAESLTMLTLSVILYVIASLGVFAVGLRYVLATPPMDYHAEITKADPPGEVTLMVMGALYKVLGGGYLAFGILLLVTSLFGVAQDLFWAKLATLLGALVAGGAATLVPFNMENRTGVRTPWRQTAALTLLTLLAFVLSLV